MFNASAKMGFEKKATKDNKNRKIGLKIGERRKHITQTCSDKE